MRQILLCVPSFRSVSIQPQDVEWTLIWGCFLSSMPAEWGSRTFPMFISSSDIQDVGVICLRVRY